jgi:hypothetical protein
MLHEFNGRTGRTVMRAMDQCMLGAHFDACKCML